MDRTGARPGARAPRRKQHLHREELRQDERFAGPRERFVCWRENESRATLAGRDPDSSSAGNRVCAPSSTALIQKPIDQSPQNTLRKSFGRRIDGRDAPEMNRNFLVVFDDFEFRMFHAETLTAQTRFAENDQALAGHDHLLDVMQIEPAADERLTEGVRIASCSVTSKDFFPAAEAIESRLDHFAAETDWLFAFLPRKSGKLAPILVPPRIMGEQIANCFETETAQLGAARTGNPLNLA